MCEKDHARAEMEQEQSKHDCARERRRKQRDTASGKGEKSLTGTCLILRLLSETLQTTTLPSSLLYLVPSTSHQHATRDIYMHISGHSSAQGILCACVFPVV